MSGDPFAFDYRTANDLVKLLKRTRNGEFAAELNDTIPMDQSAKFVWAYVPTSVTATYDSTVKAWKIGSNQVYLPINISKDGTGQVQWGMINDDGTYAGGITCTIYTPKLSSNQAAPKVGVGFYLGMVFGTDASNNPTVLIGLPPVSGSGASGGSATIELVTDVQCTPTGIQVSKVTLSGADYDNAVIKHFLALADVTPKSFLGNQGRAVVVNETATALEFGPIVTNDATTFISLTDTPNTYGITNTYKVLTVSSNNASISFSANNVTTGYSVKGGGNPNDPAYTAITLVNDEASPDANKFYGTNSSKVKGWHEITLKNLADFPDMSGASEKVLAVNYMENALEWKELSFTSLTDCPSEFTGAAGKLLKVDLQETAIEFVDLKFIDLPDVPSSYAGHGGKFVSVTVQEDGLEFSAIDIASIQTDLQTVTTGLTQAESDIGQLQSDVTQHGSDIADILSRLSTAEANIQSLQTDLATAQGNISTLQSDYSSLDARITALGG